MKHNYFDRTCSDSYRLTHLTLFNAGAYGFTADEGASKSFYEDIERVAEFAKEIGLPLVWVDSNLRSFYPETSFDWCHAFLNMGIVLSMQKLWKKYLYASGYAIEHFSFDLSDTAHYEAFLLPNLSTENTELLSASVSMSRSRKVEFIANDSIVRKHLYVCLKEQLKNSPKNIQTNNDDYLNCGHCKKCKRTMLQLDILGLLDQYHDTIDTRDWKHDKLKYIGRVLSKEKDNLMCKDLCESMRNHDYAIPMESRIWSFYYKLRHRVWTTIELVVKRWKLLSIR